MKNLLKGTGRAVAQAQLILVSFCSRLLGWIKESPTKAGSRYNELQPEQFPGDKADIDEGRALAKTQRDLTAGEPSGSSISSRRERILARVERRCNPPVPMMWPVHRMGKSRLKPFSKKMQLRMPEYYALVEELRSKCNNRSELSGEQGDWRTSFSVEPHHICGRTGKRFLDPYNIIMLNRKEHDAQDSNNYQAKMKLLEYIRPIRARQGYAIH